MVAPLPHHWTSLHTVSGLVKRLWKITCAYASLQEYLSHDGVILFCAILCCSGAGGPYILYDIEAIPPEPRQVFCHYGIQMERVMGRSAPV